MEQRTREWRSSEARFRGLVEQSAVGVVIGDAQGLSYANPDMAAMLGYDSPAAFLASGQIGGHGLVSPAGTAEGQWDQANVSLVEAQRRDGSAALLELHSQAIDPRAGGERIAIVIDVSEREREKAARNAALRAAEELSRLRMEFMANASHELRTPLNGIIGFASLGEQAQDLERARRLFTRLLVPARQLAGIIESLLDFAATEKGALQIDKRPTPLAELLEPLSGECRERAGSRGLGFAQERGQDLPQSVLIDPVRVRQVLDIFLSNAFKFTQRGAITLLARRDNDALVLGVRDTGVGIDPGYVDRVFTPFEQADGSATRRHGGAGIGLALARSLAEKMGGTIDISSVPDEGTQVLLRLPLAGIRLPESSA